MKNYCLFDLIGHILSVFCSGQGFVQVFVYPADEKLDFRNSHSIYSAVALENQSIWAPVEVSVTDQTAAFRIAIVAVRERSEVFDPAIDDVQISLRSSPG